MAHQDHYKILGVRDDAPDELIRAAFRAMSAKYHPDRNQDDPNATHNLKKLNAAYAVLGDPTKRRQYDELTRGPDGTGAGAGGAHSVDVDSAPVPSAAVTVNQQPVNAVVSTSVVERLFPTLKFGYVLLLPVTLAGMVAVAWFLFAVLKIGRP